MNRITFGTIMHMSKGKKPKKEAAEPQSGFLPYVDIQAFEKGKIASYANGENCLPCENGDILIVCDGSRSGLVGFAIKGYVGSTLAVISADGMIPKYLYYFLQSLYPLLNTRKKGTGTPHLDQNVLKNAKVCLPPLEEQARIVARIEELFSQLESGVETLKQTKAQLAVYRQAVLEDAFKGDYSRFALSDISQAISGYAFKSKLYSPSGEYVVVKIGNVKPFRFDFSRDCTKTNEFDDTILRKYRLIAGDCLITLTGSRGKRDYGYVAMIEHQTNYLLNQRVAALRFNKDVAVPQFYQYYLSSREYRNAFFSYETGNVGQGNVGIKALTETKVILPTISQQKTIITEIESRLSVCDQIEQTVDTALQQAEALRQSILKKAFEGGL